MIVKPPEATDAEILQILIAEHNNLQAIRSATVFEANGRTTLFLSAVSSSLIVLAFIGQVSEVSGAFYAFALILLPSLIFLGLVTFIRVNQTGIEDMIASRGINRIRHYYMDAAPRAAAYFILSNRDDMQGYVQNFGGQATLFQQFVSTAGLVSVINSILTAVFVGLLAYVLFAASLIVCLVVGVVVFAASVYSYIRFQHTHWQENERQMKIMFPSEPPNLNREDNR